MSNIKSPFMGQPMSSSYENQWLGADETKTSQTRRRSSQNTDNSRLHETKDAKKKPLTKAERRALQEKQRMEKQRRVSSSSNPSKSSASNKANTPVLQSAAAAATTVSKKQQQQQQQQPKRNTNALQKNILNHLELPKRPDTEENQDLHPTVLTLALLFSQYKIVGSNARCVAVLETFSKVIEDHRPPSNASFVRHIQKHLDPHIAFLLKVRSMSLSVRECIRWLKKAVADLVAIHPPMADEEARQLLKHQIEHFIHERITIADKLIVQHALSKIANGDVILTYAKSSVTERVFLEAKKAGKEFQVIVVDSRPLLEGNEPRKSVST
jgi:translation initiation factor eIF-2B subunit delta